MGSGRPVGSCAWRRPPSGLGASRRAPPPLPPRAGRSGAICITIYLHTYLFVYLSIFLSIYLNTHMYKEADQQGLARGDGRHQGAVRVVVYLASSQDTATPHYSTLLNTIPRYSTFLHTPSHYSTLLSTAPHYSAGRHGGRPAGSCAWRRPSEQT